MVILRLRKPRFKKVGRGRRKQVIMLRYVLKSKRTGRALGYHPTRESAFRQERAIQMRMKLGRRR